MLKIKMKTALQIISVEIIAVSGSYSAFKFSFRIGFSTAWNKMVDHA
jgi:hypothetical protein